jgi:hypothetical protein
MFCIRQILEKKWEHIEVVHRLYTDFKKSYDSDRREIVKYSRCVWYPQETGKANKMCLKRTAEFGWVRICLRCFQLGMV